MSNGIILTCRINSNRFPLKALRKINDKEFIVHVIDRLKKFKLEIVLATTNNKEDEILCDLAKANNIHYFKGSEDDVIKRIYDASNKLKFKNIIHTTGDNVFIDVFSSKSMFKYHLENQNDFTEMSGLPWGAFTYALKVSSISNILKFKDKIDSELWHDYFRKCNIIKSGIWYSGNHPNTYLSKIRLSCDYEKDFENIKALFLSLNLKYNNVKFDKILNFFDKKNNVKKFINSQKIIIKKSISVKKKYLKYYQ